MEIERRIGISWEDLTEILLNSGDLMREGNAESAEVIKNITLTKPKYIAFDLVRTASK